MFHTLGLLGSLYRFVVFWFSLCFGPDLTSDCVIVPTDVLPSNSLHGCLYCEDVLCLEGFSARSPGSWQGGSWVSAAEWIVLLDTFARSCFLFWCFVFVSVQDLVIQWHHLPTSLELTGQGSFCCLCCLVGFLFLCGFCFCCFLVFPVFWA